MRYSYREMSECATRELKLRKRVYPNRIMTHRMSEVQAKRELALMEAIRDHFAILAQEREELPLS